MRHLIILLILFFASPVFGASFVSCDTGNWTDQNTWNVDGAGCGVTASHPDSGDTVTIANGTTVTVNESHNLGTCTVEGGLTLGTGITATMNGTLTVGNGASKEGTLTLGAGSEIATGGYGIVNNNAVWNSNTSSSSWAKITGTGWVTTGTVYSSNRAKQDINIDYVSFQHTGVDANGLSIFFAVSDLGTVTTNQAIYNHCVFVNQTGNLKFGQSLYTPGVTAIQFNYCDFRNTASTKKISVYATSPTTTVWFKFCTFQSANYSDLRIFASGGVIEDSVFGDNFRYNIQSIQSTEDVTITRCAFSSTIGTMVYLGKGGISGSTFQDSYLHVNYLNAHPMGSVGTPTTQTTNWLRNVFENENYIQSSEWWGISTGHANYQYNVVIGVLGLYTASTTTYAYTYNNKNNTFWSYDNSYGKLFTAFHGINTGGTINLVNNIVTGAIPQTNAVGTNDITETQEVSYSDYNCFWDITTPYTASYLSVLSGQAHDITNQNPNFVDSSRDFGKWNLNYGSLTDSSADSLTYLLGINGYRGTPYFDQQGEVSVNGASHLVNWVRAGFMPLNTSLCNAGDPAEPVSCIGAISCTVGQAPFYGIKSGGATFR